MTPAREDDRARPMLMLDDDDDDYNGARPTSSGRWNRRSAAAAAAALMASLLLMAFAVILAFSSGFLWAPPPLAFRPSSASAETGSSSSNERVFKILQLADLHFGENSWTDWGPEQDRKSVAAIKSILQHETDADLVILSGDQLTANNIVRNATAYYEMILGAMVGARQDVRWAAVFGNHDDAAYEEWHLDENGEKSVTYRDAETSRADLAAVDASYRGSLTRRGPSDVFGTSNYVLNVYGPSTTYGMRGREPAVRIYLIDSGGGSLDQKLDESQVSWMREEVANHPDVPSVAFLHIPTSYDAFGYDDDVCAGMDGEGTVSPVEADAGIFDVVSRSANFRFLAVGHNHGNDYCCQREGVSVCYGRHSGYGGYGSWDRGARVFVLKFDESNDFSWHSYVRMESGEMTDEYYPLS